MDDDASLVSSTSAAIDLLDELRRDAAPGESTSELRALCVAPPDHVAWEHEPSMSSRPMPLLEHLQRALHRKLAGIETADIARFQSDGALSAARFEALVERFERLRAHRLDDIVRAALCFLDFAKGGTTEQRRRWEAGGADLTIHNLAAAEILEAEETLQRFDRFADAPVLAELTRAIVAHHGLAGQWVRGETPIVAFRGWIAWLRERRAPLAATLEVDEDTALELAADCLHLVDVCDTAAVREGLMNDRLHRELVTLRDRWVAAAEGTGLDERRTLTDRFTRLRRQALENGEPSERVNAALASLDERRRGWLAERMRNAQLWYFEPATHALSSEAALKLLCLGLAGADAAPAVDVARPFHLSLQPMVGSIGAPDRAASYRVRLVEALLGEKTIEEVVEEGDFPRNVLASFLPRIGGTTAVALELETTEEADALVTLLTIYERRSSVAFHQILKLLCDVYGLRKDDFDRLANEAQYLATMNAARSDKERMLDWVRPGTVVEMGPGGGVVLDLLEQHFPDSDLVGLDISEAVIEELRRRGTAEQRAWRVLQGDAFELADIFGEGSLDTVIFCSVLHEIYSYVEWEGRAYRLDAVRAMLREAYRTLKPGGRIVIRDGVKPAAAGRVVTFIDPEGPDFLRRFVDEFEGRDIVVDWVDEKTARMSAPDAMEFLYCYTWGAASFPYEVREQYGIMERDEYEAAVLDWLSDFDPPAVAVELRSELRSYLQPGYRDGLADKVRLSDDAGRPVALPDSNALWVFEKTDGLS